MFARHADRLTKPQTIGLNHPRIGGGAFGFIGRENDMRRFLAQDLGKHLIRGGHTSARIDDEQADIRHFHRPLRQATHASLQAVVGGIFQTGAINDSKAQITQPRLTLAQVARDTGLVVDQRQFLADETVEQSGLAHIWAPHDGERKGHGSGLSVIGEPRA